MTELDIPQERDLPPGRLATLKEGLMAQITRELDQDEPTAPVRPLRRWRRPGLAAAAAAAAAAAVFGIAAPVMLGGDDPASANTAVRTPDGDIVITVEEGKNPEALEQRLRDLGVPAVVDFVESGFECDRSRSTGWVQEPNPDLFPDSSDAPPEQVLLNPDALRPGETLAFEFYFDEFEGEAASMWVIGSSTTPIGECEPVPSSRTVDAETGTAGG